MHQRVKFGREPLNLFSPVAKHGSRRNNKRWSHFIQLFALFEQASNDLQRFTQAHVVSKTWVQTKVFKVLQPCNTSFLIVSQSSLQSFWILNRCECIFVMQP